MPINRTPDYPSYLMDLLEANRNYTRIQSINLGASSGSDGGNGAPPGGFTGKLAQQYVAYDTTEAETLSTGSISSILDNLNHIRYRISNVSAGSGAGAPLSDVLPLSVGVASAGTSGSASRYDHVHGGTTTSLSSVPALVITSGIGTAGTSGSASRYDHAHSHGVIGTADAHQVTSAGSPGFMPALDGDSTHYIDGAGNWTIPTGSGATALHMISLIAKAGSTTQYAFTDAGLSSAIAAAASGDTILLSSGSIVGGPWTVSGKNIAIVGYGAHVTSLYGSLTFANTIPASLSHLDLFGLLWIYDNVLSPTQATVYCDHVYIKNTSIYAVNLQSGHLYIRDSEVIIDDPVGSEGEAECVAAGPDSTFTAYDSSFTVAPTAASLKRIFYNSDINTIPPYAYLYNCVNTSGSSIPLSNELGYLDVYGVANTAGEGIPVRGDRSAWNVTDYPGMHAKDILDATYTRHLPNVTVVGRFPTWDGTKWTSSGSVPQVHIADVINTSGSVGDMRNKFNALLRSLEDAGILKTS